MKRKISENDSRVEALDGLRGFAAILVLMSHTSNSSMYFLPYLDARGIGKSGVFLFFLLSSFLLSRAFLSKGGAAFSLASLRLYFIRRFLRIYPLYVPYLVLGIVATCLFGNLAIPFELTTTEFLRHLVLIEGKGVTWSIAVEFKFYFLLPLLMWLVLMTRSYYGDVGGIALLVLIILVSQIISPSNESVTNDPRLLPYLSIFVIGALAATIQSKIGESQIKKMIVPLGYCSAGALLFMTPSVASLVLGELPSNYFHKSFILYSVLWAVILLSVTSSESLMANFLQNRLMKYLGAVSFSVYLFHPIVINLLAKLSLNSFIAAWGVLGITLFLASISFKHIEKPMSEYGFKKNPIRRAGS